LLEQFVCVRIVGTNGLDLNVFQYDTDQSFAMFMLNADQTVYGRFGTRSHRTEWTGDVSLEGMARALEGALELHKNYPANKESLAAKSNRPTEFDTPEKFPTLRNRPARLDYDGKVAASCIHCHQIGEARRDYYWRQSKPIPEQLMYPYPHPKSIGLVLDPEQRARARQIVEGSPAAAAGLQRGDDILKMAGQPLLSMADVQWVLDGVPAAGGRVEMQVRRGERELSLLLVLKEGWRRVDDTSWRSSSWVMRRAATGGMRLVPVSDADRQELGVSGTMALRIDYLSPFGPYAAAKNAGFVVGDVLIEYDGRGDLRRESDLFDHANHNKKPGDKVSVKLLRNGQVLSKQLPIQQ
jgi:predicted metalloprotease with PDZ domain